MRHHKKPHCGCPKQIVYPTKYNCVKNYSESQVDHIYPSHTTIMNHHTVKNKHLYPHSTSVQNTKNCVDVYGGSFNVPAPGQVGGAMDPGMGPGPGHGQVAGEMDPGMHGPHHWKKPNKWC